MEVISVKEIRELEDYIDEELNDAKKYINCALNYKNTRPELANLYYTLSQEEMSHMDRLHKMVITIIEDYRKSHGEPPTDMMAVYNYVHEKSIERAKEVKILIAMYKE